MSTFPKGLPFFCSGVVVKGFGRGSKELGIPTANFPENIVDLLPNELNCGIYFGWAKVNDSPVYKMVMSVGWNPYYKNKKKSMETHVLHNFKKDFYGANLKVLLLGYIRPEKNFNSLNDLIAEINLDVKKAEELLNQKPYCNYSRHPLFEKNGATHSYLNGYCK